MDGEDVVEDVLHRAVRRFAVLHALVSREFREGLAVVAQDPPVILVDGPEVRRRGHVAPYDPEIIKDSAGAARTRALEARRARPVALRKETPFGIDAPGGTRRQRRRSPSRGSRPIPGTRRGRSRSRRTPRRTRVAGEPTGDRPRCGEPRASPRPGSRPPRGP